MLSADGLVPVSPKPSADNMLFTVAHNIYLKLSANIMALICNGSTRKY